MCGALTCNCTILSGFILSESPWRTPTPRGIVKNDNNWLQIMGEKASSQLTNNVMLVGARKGSAKNLKGRFREKLQCIPSNLEGCVYVQGYVYVQG